MSDDKAVPIREVLASGSFRFAMFGVAFIMGIGVISGLH